MAKRRLRDEWGSITEIDRNERYRIRYWGKDENGTYRRMTCTVRGTRRDAERKRAELMLEHSEEAQCVNVDYVWEHWYMPMLERRCDEGELSEKTASQYKSRYRSTIAERWGSVPCDGIRPLDVQQWVDTLSYNKANQSLNMLRPMLDFAVRYGEILNNPFRERYVMPSKSTIAHRDDGVWTLSQLTTVWEKVRGEWFEGAFICAAFGGCRVGESIGVQVNDIERVDIDGLAVAVVRIRRQVKNAGGVTDRLKNPRAGGRSSLSESLPSGSARSPRRLRYGLLATALASRRSSSLLGHPGSVSRVASLTGCGTRSAISGTATRPS